MEGISQGIMKNKTKGLAESCTKRFMKHRMFSSGFDSSLKNRVDVETLAVAFQFLDFNMLIGFLGSFDRKDLVLLHISLYKQEETEIGFLDSHRHRRKASKSKKYVSRFWN